MLIKILRGNLLDLMGETVARSDWTQTIGANVLIQINDKDTEEMITIFQVLDLELWNSKLKSLNSADYNSIDKVNDLIKVHNMDIYKIENEGLMNANISILVSTGEINLNNMNIKWSEQEELEHLYNKGCSGISKKSKYQLL